MRERDGSFELKGRLPEKSDFSVQPLRPLCLCGCFYEQFLNHRVTEDVEVAQRRSPIRTFRVQPVKGDQDESINCSSLAYRLCDLFLEWLD
jgi:hypothetical protein